MPTDRRHLERRRRARFGRLLLLALLSLALLLAGCGDGENVDSILGAEDDRVATTSLPSVTLPPTTVSPSSLPPTSLPPTSLPPTSLPPTSLPPTSLPSTSLPPTTSLTPTAPAPTSFVTVDQRASDGFTLMLEQSYIPFEPYGDLTAQADAIGVDGAGRAAIDSFAANRSAADFRMVAFRFNTGSIHTDNALVVRYENPGNEMGPEDLEPTYRAGFEKPGGSVLSSEVGIVNDRPALVMEGERVVAGEIFNRQFVAVVFGDEEIWEVVVTIGLPIDEPTRVIGRQIVSSFTLSAAP